MLTLKEKVQAIRKELKAIGITTKQVSVKGKDALYDESIKINIKDLNVKIQTVENIAHKYEQLDIDKASGEILQGCNTYVSVDLDYESLLEARKDFLNKANDILTESNKIAEDDNLTILDDDRLKIIYTKCNSNIPYLQLLQKPEDYKNLTCYCFETIKNFKAYGVEGIAEILAIFKYQYGLNV